MNFLAGSTHRCSPTWHATLLFCVNSVLLAISRMDSRASTSPILAAAQASGGARASRMASSSWGTAFKIREALSVSFDRAINESYSHLISATQ